MSLNQDLKKKSGQSEVKISKNVEIQEGIQWSPPSRGWFKIKFDGLSRGNPGIARAREEVIRDDSSKFLEAFHNFTGQATNYQRTRASLQELTKTGEWEHQKSLMKGIQRC
jgi:hypothetical protein